MAAAAASSSGGGSGRKRRRSSVPPRRDGPAPAAAAAAAAARPACVAAAVDAVEAVKQRRAERAAKRRRKDRDRTAKLKRQKQALRDHRDMVKVVIGAAAEGYSRGAVRAALHAAADEYGVQLPLQQQAVAAGAAAAAADVASSDSDADASDAVDAESDAAADEDEAEGTEAEAEACALRARVRELSPFARSKSWTTDMKRLLVLAAVHHVYARQQLARKTGRGLKPAAGAATAAAQFFGANRSRVSAVLKEYAPSGISLTAPHYEFPESDTARAARTDVVELTESQIQAVRDMLKKRAADGATTSYGLIHSHLKETTGLHCSHRVMRERLCELGFGVIGVRSGPVVDLQSDYWCRQRERYIMEYAAAREAELKGDSVIVFVDQSFVNLRHRRTQTVADLNDASYVARPHRSGPKAVLRTGIGKGQLLIISHAITRDGLLARLSPDGQMDRPQFAYDPTAVSAELIYESGKENEDYHSHFDNFTFLNWVQKQLFPAFNAKYPGKRMVLVLDNSGNQSAVRSDYVKPAASKQELHDVLVANGVTELTVQRRLDNGKSSRRALTSSFVMLPRVLPSDMWMHRAPDGASAEELTAAVRDLYKQKPHLTWSQLEVIVNAGGPAPPPGTADQRKSNFHRVIWTVAYHSESNPIEKQWAVAKNFVAAQHTGNRTMAALRQELLAGLYGDEKDHAGVTAESCAAAADHCERELTEWMHQSQRIRALFPGRGSSAMTIASLNARRRQQYGPLVRPHRRGSRRNEADDAAEQDGCGEDDGSDDLALPPPAAAAAPAPAAASASSAAR